MWLTYSTMHDVQHSLPLGSAWKRANVNTATHNGRNAITGLPGGVDSTLILP